MNGGDIQAEIVTNAEALQALRPEWEAVYAAHGVQPSTSPEWTLTLLDTHRLPTDVVFTVVLREAARIIAIAPLVIRSERVAGLLPVATLMPVSEMYRTHSDILGECSRPEVVAALWRACQSVPQRWDMFRVGRLLEAGELARGLRAFVSAGETAARIRREHPSFLIELRGSYGDFLAGRSSKFRNYLRRRSRQLEERGNVSIRRAGQELGVQEAYRDLLSVEERSWKHGHGTAITSIARQQAFYRQLCDGAAARGRLHLTLMYLDDRPVAFNLGVVAARTYYYLKTSYDAALRPLGPATVFRARLIESLIDEGIGSIDFPGEPYQWEEQWSGTLRWNESVVLFNRHPRAWLCRAITGLRGLGRLRHDEDVRYVDPRRQGGD